MEASSDDPDAALVTRIGEGDKAAFRAFVVAKLPRVHALASRILADPAAADDVAQDAFERVWRHAGDWRPGRARFDTWLHRVVLNLCTDRLRRRRREVPAPHDLPDRPDPAPGPEASLAKNDDVRRLRAALERLPPRQKQALMLHAYAELSHVEIAAALGVGPKALESLLARGRRTLRGLLAAFEP